MSGLKEMRTIVRTEAVERLVTALREAGVSRLWVSHVHSVGAGVDPEDYRLSFEEGGSYTRKAKVEFVTDADEVETLARVILAEVGTGHRGDGVVVISDVDEVVNVRTGDRNGLALL